MDMEHLSKSQIVLLTLMVSFVTSIATGIVTVSLFDQAPPIVAQTVNRVIEKTVETVAAAPASGQPAAVAQPTIVTKEKTVVVSEADMISKAVEAVSPSIVRVYSSDDAATFLGLGVVMDAGGTVIADGSALGERPEAMLAMPDGTRVRAFVNKRDDGRGLAFLHTSTTTEAAAQKLIVWKPVSFATDKPVLGSSAVALSGKSVSRIASGLVTALMQTDSGTVIDTDIAEASILPGSPLIDSSGNLLGVSTGASRTSSAQGFIAAAEMLAQKKGQ